MSKELLQAYKLPREIRCTLCHVCPGLKTYTILYFGTLTPKGSDLQKIKRNLSRENISYSNSLLCSCQSLSPSAFLLLSTFFPTFPLCLNLRKSLCFLTGRNISSQKCLWVIDNDTQFVFCSLRTSQANFSSILSIASIHLSFGILAAY